MSTINSTVPSRCAEHWLYRAVRPSDFSYKHKAERTVNLVLTPLSDHVDGGIIDGLRAALDVSPPGTQPHIWLIVCEYDVVIRTTADNVVISDVLVPPKQRTIEEHTAADIGIIEVGR